MKYTTNKASKPFQNAFIAHQSGRLNDAVKLYRQALRHSPADMETLYLLGTVLGELAKSCF